MFFEVRNFFHIALGYVTKRVIVVNNLTFNYSLSTCSESNFNLVSQKARINHKNYKGRCAEQKKIHTKGQAQCVEGSKL